MVKLPEIGRVIGLDSVRPSGRKYPFIQRVLDEIDADNGLHHVERIEGDDSGILDRERRFLHAAETFDEATLSDWDKWLATLDPDDLRMIATGGENGEEDQLAVLGRHPRGNELFEFLTSYFEGPEMYDDFE